jgi:tRNA pseudouridine55 synthase
MRSADNSASSGEPISGFLLVDKPLGLSSMQAVARVRRAAAGARTGHAGTLDPLATGLLVVAIGRATRSLKHLTGLDKRYHTDIDLSAFTTTDDMEGERENVNVVAPPARDDIERALHGFTGEILQTPPAFSAVKIAGRRAYKLARRGLPPEMPPRHVTLHDAVITHYAWPKLGLELHTGSGFYVRSLARDLGKSLGTGGHCASIRRTAVGPFSLDEAMTLEGLPGQLNQSDLLPVEDVLAKGKSF